MFFKRLSKRKIDHKISVIFTIVKIAPRRNIQKLKLYSTRLDMLRVKK